MKAYKILQNLLCSTYINKVKCLEAWRFEFQPSERLSSLNRWVCWRQQRRTWTSLFLRASPPFKCCLRPGKREHRLNSFPQVSSWQNICKPRQDFFQFRRHAASVANLFRWYSSDIAVVWSTSTFCLSFIKLQVLHSACRFGKLYISPAQYISQCSLHPWESKHR